MLRYITYDAQTLNRYEREETFMALNLGVTSCQSLEISLDQFVRGEVLEGSNAYYCEKCKDKVCIRLYMFIIPAHSYYVYLQCGFAFSCTEDHSEEDLHQIPAQRSLYSPHALRLWLGKRTLDQIWRTDSGTKYFLILHYLSQTISDVCTLNPSNTNTFYLTLYCLCAVPLGS